MNVRNLILVLLIALPVSSANSDCGRADSTSIGSKASEADGNPAVLNNFQLGVAKEIYFKIAPRSVVIGNPSVAEIKMIGEKTAVLFPKSIGVTSLVAFDDNGRVMLNTVIPVVDSRTISVWVAGEHTNLWCSNGYCLSDVEVNRKNIARNRSLMSSDAAPDTDKTEAEINIKVGKNSSE